MPPPSAAFVSKWGTENMVDGQFKNPEGVALTPVKSVYVAITGNNDLIQKYSVGP